MKSVRRERNSGTHRCSARVKAGASVKRPGVISRRSVGGSERRIGPPLLAKPLLTQGFRGFRGGAGIRVETRPLKNTAACAACPRRTEIHPDVALRARWIVRGSCGQLVDLHGKEGWHVSDQEGCRGVLRSGAVGRACCGPCRTGGFAAQVRAGPARQPASGIQAGQLLRVVPLDRGLLTMGSPLSRQRTDRLLSAGFALHTWTHPENARREVCLLSPEASARRLPGTREVPQSPDECK